MLTNQASINESKSGSGQAPTNKPNKQRRALIGGALAALLSSPRRVKAERNDGKPNDPFILLLKGVYQPVPAGHGPADNLGLSTVNLSDGSYSRTLIYPVFGIPESTDQDRLLGSFYVQFTGNLCAYDLPGGAIAMQFLDVPPPLSNPNALGYNNFSTIAHPDGMGGQYLEGTFELTILEATGIYKAFAGGHNHMVDRLHQLPLGAGFDEFCFCNISQYQFP
jgi:hypothetical protein